MKIMYPLVNYSKNERMVPKLAKIRDKKHPRSTAEPPPFLWALAAIVLAAPTARMLQHGGLNATVTATEAAMATMLANAPTPPLGGLNDALAAPPPQ